MFEAQKFDTLETSLITLIEKVQVKDKVKVRHMLSQLSGPLSVLGLSEICEAIA